MKLRRSSLVALGIGALAIPAAAMAKPGHGHGHGHGPSGHGHNPTVMYVFKGTYGDTPGSVSVAKGNGHVKKAGLVGQDVQFDLSNARLQVADTDADGIVTAADIVAGDAVQVQARLPKQDPGAQPFAAKKLIDKTNPAGDDHSGGDED